jgi:hypothetical protein
MEDGLTLSAVLDNVAISLRLEAIGPAACLVIPFAAFATLEGASGGAVKLEEFEPGCVRCLWTERGVSKELSLESLPVEDEHELKPVPPTWQAVDPTFLAALHACGATTGPAGNRFALSRIQLRGREGRVVGTDGRQLLLRGGFTLPFTDNVLIPAVPVFGSRELAEETAIRIGRTDDHVVVSVGPWTVWLTIDMTARFPDVTAVIPRGTRAARLLIADEDAAAILRLLEREPRDSEEPVCLRLGPRPMLRLEAKDNARGSDLWLSQSSSSGPEHAVLVERQHLARALALGLREVRAAPDQTPVHFVNRSTSYVVASMEAKSASPAETATAPSDVSLPTVSSPIEEGDPPMTREKNGHPPLDPAGEVMDPIAEAEALRAALTEAGRRLGRLVVSLRQIQKRQRVFQTAWSSLQHLQIGAKEKA